MDPFTLGLIGAGILAAIGIKRGSTPRASHVQETPEDEEPYSMLPPRLFRGGLPTPATGRTAKAREREAAAAGKGERAPGEEPAAVAPIGIAAASARAAQAIGSSGAADVIGIAAAPRTSTTTYTSPTTSGGTILSSTGRGPRR